MSTAYAQRVLRLAAECRVMDTTRDPRRDTTAAPDGDTRVMPPAGVSRRSRHHHFRRDSGWARSPATPGAPGSGGKWFYRAAVVVILA